MANLAPLASETLGQADEPSSPVLRFSRDEPLALDAGVALGPWQIAYQTYGRLNPQRSYAVDFPLVTVRDMVRAQAQLVDRLGIRDLFCVIGGSMGGMQVLQWAASYGPRVFSALPI